MIDWRLDPQMTTEEKMYRYRIKKDNMRLYNILHNMAQRCYNKNNERYKDYGARGVVVCDEWKQDFMNFYEWAISNGYRDDLTINRIDNNGNYEPDNCEWTDYKVQNRNQRNTKYITYQDETKSLAEWCELYNKKYSKVWKRLKRGWSIERALDLK